MKRGKANIYGYKVVDDGLERIMLCEVDCWFTEIADDKYSYPVMLHRSVGNPKQWTCSEYASGCGIASEKKGQMLREVYLIRRC